MKKSKVMKLLSLFVLGIILGVGSMAVYAYTVADGNKTYYGPVNGYSYLSYASVEEWGTGVGVDANMTVSDQGYDQDIPTSYMGAKVWLYKDSAIVKSTDWAYNTSPQKAFWLWTDYNYVTGYYYADGQSRAYNGNGYNTYDAYSSPIVHYNNN